MIGKNAVRTFALVAALTLPGALCDARETSSCRGAVVDYSVSLPQRDDDVAYKLTLAEQPAPQDSLLGKSYYIQWEYLADGTRGFACYFDGNLFTYNGTDRLREYHVGWDPTPFHPKPAGGNRPLGVHRAVRFFKLLPSEIYAELEAIHSDSEWSVSTSGYTTEAVMHLPDGEEAMRKTFSLPNDSTITILTEYNIGQISEQSEKTSVFFVTNDCPPQSEEELASLWPEVFDRLRESNFSIESLTGTPFPTLSLPTLTGERYEHLKTQPFRQPTVVALIDPAQGASKEMVEILRHSADSSPRPFDLIMAFTGTDIDAIETLTGPLRMGEHILMNAQASARALGAANLPVVLICSPKGIIDNVTVGLNPQLQSIVINTISRN